MGILGRLFGGEVHNQDIDRRFIAYENGTVLDTVTGLMWAAKDNGSDITWASAKSYCENYRGGGCSGWRIPTLDELAGLYDSSKTKPGIYSKWHIHVATELINITGYGYWTSETRGSEAALFVFNGGGRYWRDPSYDIVNLRALPVRSGK